MNINYRWTLILLFGLAWIQPGLAERQVSVIRFGDIALSKTLQFPASVINLQLASIAAEANGRINQFPVQVGDVVNNAEVLVQLDCKTSVINQTRIKAGIKQLLAKRQLTLQQLERAQRLSNSRSISREELDQRQTQLEADNASIEEMEASLEAATQNVNNCHIRAPFSGMVIEKMSSIGSYATVGSPLLKLLQQDAVEIQLELPRDKVGVLQKAQLIKFESSGFDYKLKLRQVLPVVDPGSLQQIIRLQVDHSPVPPGGSFGMVTFDTERHYLPARYVQKRDGQLGFFMLSQQQAHFIPVAKAEEGQSVAVTLEQGDLIISSHLQTLVDREKVTTQP